MSTSLHLSTSVHSAGQEPRAATPKREAQTPEQSPRVLREGDIVRGTVVDTTARGTATVELPQGVVSAVLATDTDRLRRGDSLLFRVRTVDPGPVLQVHGIAGTAKELHESDIVRILGVQANPVTLEIARTLRRMKATVTVQDMQDVLQGLAIPPVRASLREQIEIVGRMRDAGIPFDPKLYGMMESLFIGGRDMECHIGTLRAGNAASPSDTALESVLAAISRPFSTVRDVLRRFSLSGGADSLYELLRGLTTRETAGAAPSALHAAALGLMETMEAQQVYNIFALQHNAALMFHIVLPFRNGVLAGRLEIDGTAGADGKEGPRSFRVTTDMSALGEVTASGFAVRKLLSLTILTDTPDDAEFIDQYRADLADSLRQVGFALQSLHIRDRNSGDDLFPKTIQHVNLVV